jgi:hypothetical protein
MAYCETKVRNWLYKHHKGSVYYRAKPVYRGTGAGSHARCSWT